MDRRALLSTSTALAFDTAPSLAGAAGVRSRAAQAGRERPLGAIVLESVGRVMAGINGLMTGLARAAGFPARDVYGIRVGDGR